MGGDRSRFRRLFVELDDVIDMILFVTELTDDEVRNARTRRPRSMISGTYHIIAASKAEL